MSVAGYSEPRGMAAQARNGSRYSRYSTPPHYPHIPECGIVWMLRGKGACPSLPTPRSPTRNASLATLVREHQPAHGGRDRRHGAERLIGVGTLAWVENISLDRASKRWCVYSMAQCVSRETNTAPELAERRSRATLRRMDHEPADCTTTDQIDGGFDVGCATSDRFDHERSPFVAAVQAGLDDRVAGRVKSHEEVGRILDEHFGSLRNHEPA